MIDPAGLASDLERFGLPAWSGVVERQLQERLVDKVHGDAARWAAALKSLPEVTTRALDLRTGVVVGRAGDVSAEVGGQIETGLRGLSPWRKGPYEVHGVQVDTEWRSDWKWDRVRPHLEPLAGRRVLDVGCGNGYHCWRALGDGAAWVLGIDPSLLFLAQFEAIRHFVASCAGSGTGQVRLLPLGIEHVPPGLRAFDTTFSMGVLYHRRSPLDHLYALRETLRPGGQLVLETLVVDGMRGHALLPEGRYAQMRNVWFIPSVPTLESWLQRCGFRNVCTVDVNRTSTEEQRSTSWMTFNSLADFLDPADKRLTVEGYQAPTRAVLTATA